MAGLHSDKKEIQNELDAIKELKQSVTFTQDELLDVRKDIEALRKLVEKHESDSNEMSNRLSECMKQNQEMHDKLLNLDTYIRRENLKFTGIKKDRNESAFVAEKTILELFVEKLQIEYGSEIEFQRCHRLGPKPENGKGNREIIVRFLWFQDREDVWNKKRKLKGTISAEFSVQESFRRQDNEILI